MWVVTSRRRLILLVHVWLRRRLTAAYGCLLQMCPRPEVVEVWDVTSPDPRLLVWLKVLIYTCCHFATALLCLPAAVKHQRSISWLNLQTSDIHSFTLPSVVPPGAMNKRPRMLGVPSQALRNTTAVPRHWSQKRKYLQVRSWLSAAEHINSAVHSAPEGKK